MALEQVLMNYKEEVKVIPGIDELMSCETADTCNVSPTQLAHCLIIISVSINQIGSDSVTDVT